MQSHVYSDLERSDITPIDQICSKEYTEGVLKAGSIISLIENKKLNPINFFIYCSMSKSFRKEFCLLFKLNMNR